jgi:uncharacterized protein with PQ loop repeat
MLSTEFILNIANLLQASLAGVTLFAVLPQWLQIRRSQSSSNISLLSWFVWSAASLISVFYSSCQVVVLGNGYALLMTTLVSLVCNLYTVYLIIAFRSRAMPAVKTTMANVQSSSRLLEILDRIDQEIEASAVNPLSIMRGEEVSPQLYH